LRIHFTTRGQSLHVMYVSMHACMHVCVHVCISACGLCMCTTVQCVYYIAKEDLTQMKNDVSMHVWMDMLHGHTWHPVDACMAGWWIMDYRWM
jgi:hypothetical protein